MLNLSPKKLKAIAKIRGTRDYKGMSEDELLSALTSSKPVKKVKNQKQIFLKQEYKSLENNLMNQGINFINQKSMGLEEIFMK